MFETQLQRNGKWYEKKTRMNENANNVCTNWGEMKSENEYVCVCGCKCEWVFVNKVRHQSNTRRVQSSEPSLFPNSNLVLLFCWCCLRCLQIRGHVRECVRGEPLFVRETRRKHKGCLIGQYWNSYPAQHIRRPRACHPNVICLCSATHRHNGWMEVWHGFGRLSFVWLAYGCESTMRKIRTRRGCW